jgi:hypothetical protein
MRGRWILRGLKFVLFIIAAALVLGYVVMHLWNWLLPAVFGWHMINYWQALGILALTRLLFGGFRGHRGGGMHWRRRMMERWERMTPAEREKFRQGMGGRCGGGKFQTPATEAKT